MKKIAKRVLDKFKLTKYAYIIRDRSNSLRYKFSKENKEIVKRISFYKNFIEKNDLVFDIGANTGNRTEAFLRMHTKVLAIEPQDNCALLLKNKFGTNPNFHLFKGGMGPKKGKGEIYLATTDTISSMNKKWIDTVQEKVFTSDKWEKKVEIEVDTIDNMVKKYGNPKFIKIDVEGYEMEVLKGLSKKANYVSFEFMLPIFFDEAIKCLEYLHKLGDIECNFSWGESMKFANRHWLSYEDFIKEMHKVKETNNFGDIYIRFL